MRLRALMITTENLNKILLKHNHLYFSGVECLSGWNDLILECHEKLLSIDNNYKICQIKEKFGGLRYYFDTCKVPSVWEDMHHIVSEYERESKTICENCGKTGSALTLDNWMKTFCQECLAEFTRKNQVVRRGHIRTKK